MIGVVAGNHREYLTYLQSILKQAKKKDSSLISITGGLSEIDGVKYFYVRDTNSVRGIRNFELKFYGNWHMRWDDGDLTYLEQMEKASKV